MAAQNLHARTKLRLATFDTNHFVTDITQTVDVLGETIRLSINLRLEIDFFLHVMYIKHKQVLVFNFIFDLLWTGGGSSVSSVAFDGFRELQQIEKHGIK